MKEKLENRKSKNSERLKIKNKEYKPTKFTVGAISIAHNFMKNNKVNVGAGLVSARAITLISLVITIILLIILTGVVINLSLGENGLINKTKNAIEKYKIEEIRETVEIGILDIETQEVNLGNEITIEKMLQELLDKSIFESIDKEANVGYIGEYEVKLKYNENNKVVIEYIQKATGVRVTYTLDPSTYTNKEEVNILLKVQGKVKSVTKPDGLTIYTKNETIDYKVTANGTYKFIIENEEGKQIEKNVIVDIIDTLPPKDFSITAKDTETGFIMSANVEDAEETRNEEGKLISAKSGIEKVEYYIKKEAEPITEYKKYETNEIQDLEIGKYNIYAISYDKAGNKRQIDPITVELKIKIKFTKISTGYNHSSALDIEGKRWTWGRNSMGELGDGTTENRLTPIRIKEDIKFNQISSYSKSNIAIDEEGNLWAWGRNYYGQLGDGTTEDRLTPVKIKEGTKFKQVSAGLDYSMAIDKEGNLWSWGSKNDGRLGDGTTENRLTPVKIKEGTKFKQVSAGHGHSLAIDMEGNLWVWGSNDYGELGDGTTENRRTPIQIKEGTKFKQVSAGRGSSMAIDEEGNLWAWGRNYTGQLGNNGVGNGTGIMDITIQTIPVKIKEGIKYTKISTYGHTLAIDENGQLWVWGNNYYGQLGDGTKEYRNTPIKIKEGVIFTEVSVGENYSLALDEEGGLWAWGYNNYGQLGDGTTEDKLVPTKIY